MADKKISELPLITTISGSIVFVPIVHDGITEKITVEDFSKFTNKYAAQTGSVNIFTANQTITANLSVGGTSTLTGNTSIGGNLVVNGKLTAQELFTEITSASIIFESGSTIFGNSADDTHQFTGIVSINGTTIGAQALNDFTASTNNQLQRVYQTTSSLNIQTGSQDLVNLRISSTTGSINTTTSSFDSVFLRISSTTGSINTTTSSFDSVFLRISSTTGSINTTTSSFNSEFIKIGSTTSSIHFTTQSLNVQTGSQDNLNAQIGIATGSLNAFTGSVIGQTNTISTFTASVNFTTQSLNTQTGSQNSINFNISVVTSSIDAHILKQSIQTGSQDLINYNLSVVTSSINTHILKQATQTGSQDLVNLGISTFTGSLRTEVNLIEAYTASLKAAAIVSSSQQITNYYKFAETASANTFYGNQNINGELNASIVRSNSHYIVSDGSAAAVVFQGYINNYLRIAESGSASSGGARGGLYVGAIDVGGTTAFAENLVMASGKGIDFSATSNGSGTTSSELLNDYEEGTWTPTVTFVGTPGTVNYVARTGRYTKIGRIVHLEYSITACSITGSAGYIVITGIPFTINASTAGYQSFAPYGATTFPSSSVLYQQGGTGDTKIYPQSITNSGFYGDMTNTNINSGGSFSVAATYTYST